MLDGSHSLSRMLAKIANQPVEIVSAVLGGWSSLNECLPDRTQNVAADLLRLLTTVAGTGIPTCVNMEQAESEEGGVAREYLFRADGDGFVASKDALVAGARSVVLECSHAQLVAKPEAVKVWLDLLSAEPSGSAAAGPTPAPGEQLRGHEDLLPEVITSVELIEVATGALGSVTLVYP
jgi:hypothetical protein